VSPWLVAGQMAERYMLGPDKVTQFGMLDMKEATALACEMVRPLNPRTQTLNIKP